VKSTGRQRVVERVDSRGEVDAWMPQKGRRSKGTKGGAEGRSVETKVYGVGREFKPYVDDGDQGI